MASNCARSWGTPVALSVGSSSSRACKAKLSTSGMSAACTASILTLIAKDAARYPLASVSQHAIGHRHRKVNKPVGRFRQQMSLHRWPSLGNQQGVVLERGQFAHEIGRAS